MDVKGSPTAIDDASFAWLENVMWIGTGQLAFLPSAASAPIYTAPGGLTIATYTFYVLAGVPHFAIFLSDGSGVTIRSDGTGLQTMGGPGAFALTPTLPVTACYGAQYLCIGTSTQYLIWDGFNLYGPETLAPQVIVTNPGSGYSSPPTVVVSGGSGSGATGTATLGGTGGVTGITLNSPGSGYQPTDGAALNVVVTGGGNPNRLAQGTATISGGGVVSVTITNGGTGYSNQPSVTFAGGGGSGASGVAAGSNDTITQVVMVTPGVGYTSAPSVTFGAPTGGGATATGVALVSLQGISAVTVTDAGAGYTSTPTVSIVDPFGYGFGAVATATMGAGVVTGVTVINPGQDYRAAVVKFVGGNPTVATASAEIMPFGGAHPVSGTAIQIFKNRVWMVNDTYRYTSAAGDVANFSASAGGVISQNNDNFLIYKLFGLAQSSGFLYEFGDSSVNAISNPVATTSATGTVSTTFTVTNVDPQVGTSWPQTIQPFGEAIIFANPTGVYGLYGSSVRKISTDLDDLFNNLPAQPLVPAASTVMLFGIKCYCLTLQITDPFLNTNRQMLLLWDGFRWFAATQEVLVNQLVTLGFNSTFSSYGGDQHSIWLLFTRPSPTLGKTIISKFYGATSALKAKRAMRFYLTAEQPMSYGVVVHSELGDVTLPTITYPNSALIMPSPPGAYGRFYTLQYQDALGTLGHYLGWTLQSLAPSNNINYMALAWVPDAPAF
jgi:hypothetical protein